METNSFILQMKTVAVNRNPHRASENDNAKPAFCYVEVDEALSHKIETQHSRIIKTDLESLSLIDNSPQWRFSANRYNRPTRPRNSCLNISHNYVWFSVALHEGFDDFETSRVPISVFAPDDSAPGESQTLNTDYRAASREFKRLVDLDKRVEEISDYQSGLFDVESALEELNMPMESVVGQQFTDLVEAASKAMSDLQNEYDDLEKRISEVEWRICEASLGLRKGQDFAALDRESRLIRIQADWVSISVSNMSIYLSGKKYRKDGELGKLQGWLDVDLQPMLGGDDVQT